MDITIYKAKGYTNAFMPCFHVSCRISYNIFLLQKFEGWVFTFGYGGTYNIDLIDAISNQGAGYAFHIGNKREVSFYFNKIPYV